MNFDFEWIGKTDLGEVGTGVLTVKTKNGSMYA
jgi:hypothetical protein